MAELDDAPTWRAMPDPVPLPATRISQQFQAYDNFVQMFDIHAGERVLMLTDRRLDQRVVAAVAGLAQSRGASFQVFEAADTRYPDIPDELKPLLEKATFVVSTWFCSVISPYCIGLRRDMGQRWVKITYFRNLDLLETEQARFPMELVGALISQTGERYPRNQDFDLRFTDPRGSDFTIPFKPHAVDTMMATARWRGHVTASEPGCYVHYLPTHGPNLYERALTVKRRDEIVPMAGVVFPQAAVGFPKPFAERIGVEFRDDRVVAVHGRSGEAGILRDMLVGGQLIELGCGFNPKAPRRTIYPAGSNSPGALHFGIDLAKPDHYIRRVMPYWEEPPIHMDLVMLDMTVTAGTATLIKDGFLEALRDDEVVRLAERYGDPVDLLEAWPD